VKVSKLTLIIGLIVAVLISSLLSVAVTALVLLKPKDSLSSPSIVYKSKSIVPPLADFIDVNSSILTYHFPVSNDFQEMPYGSFNVSIKMSSSPALLVIFTATNSYIFRGQGRAIIWLRVVADEWELNPYWASITLDSESVGSGISLVFWTDRVENINPDEWGVYNFRVRVEWVVSSDVLGGIGVRLVDAKMTAIAFDPSLRIY
jgi:hypothetical protein